MKKKLLFVNDEMTLGGVSRILNTLLSKLDQDKYEVDLLVLNPHGELMDQIPPWINVIPSSPFFKYVDKNINILIKNKSIFEIYKKLSFFMIMKTGLIKKRIIKERMKILNKHYDVEFAAKEGFCTIFTAYGDSFNKLNWVQTDYKKNNYARRHINLLKNALTKIDINIACSKQVANAFSEEFEIDNIVVIPNMINEDTIRELSYKDIDSNVSNAVNLISVARFHPQKGLDRLITALRYVKDHNINVNLDLIGDGLLMKDIRKQVKKLDLTKEVNFLGYQVNPYPYIRQADLFVLSSHYEGYPTIVIESLICTTPVLAMDVAGVKDQIVENHHGIVIENKQIALNETLLDLCSKKDMLYTYKQKLSFYHYDNERIIKQICYYIDNKAEGEAYEKNSI